MRGKTNFSSIKHTIEKVKRAATEWDKIYTIYVTDKGCVCRIYQQYCKSILQRLTIQFLKMSETWISPAQKRLSKWLINIWKSAQSNSSLGKCKLKLYWDTILPIRMAKI